jgi:hypothetical protein
MHRFYARAVALLVAASFAFTPTAADAVRKKTTKAKRAVSAPTKPPKPTIPLSKIKLPEDKKTDFCKVATETKAKLADIKSKKTQLGTSTPSSLYRTEIDVDKGLEKVSPKELAPDYAVIRDYLGLFAVFADTKDGDKLAKMANEMSSDAVLGRYFDATVRVEAFVRRSCGFPVGI